MRIAHFVQRYPPALGGSEAYFARLSGWLAQQDDEVTVFTTTALDLEAFWRADARCLRAGTSCENRVLVRRYGLVRWPGRRYLLKALSFCPHRLWQCLTLPCNPISGRMWSDAGKARPRFDIVHATAFPYAWPMACALRLARRQRIPFCLTPFLHLGDPDDPDDRTRRRYLSPPFLYLLRAADCIFVQTNLEREALLGCGLQEEKLVQQGLGVDPAECTGGDREKARRRWQVEPAEVVVGHLANLSEEKGSVDLLRAAELAWQQGARFTVVLAGPQMANFRRFFSTYRMAETVRCLGIVSDEEKRDFYAGIDLFALPSRSDSFGLVLLEAWANGLANVAYRAGGVAELIRPGQDGCLVRCGDIRELGATLQMLVSDPELRRRFGCAGRRRIALEFPWSDKLALVRAVYSRSSGRSDRGLWPPLSSGRSLIADGSC